MEGISLFLWILHEKGSHGSYYRPNQKAAAARKSALAPALAVPGRDRVQPESPLADWYKKREASLLLYVDSGNVLLSRAVSSQVPSALKGLTSVFGMGTGGTPSPSSPETVNFFFPRTLTTAQLF